jgi:hypothetical protein
MPEYDWLELACTRLAVKSSDIMSHRVYTDESGVDVIALVVFPGPKHIFPLEELIPKSKEIPEEIPGDEVLDAPDVDLPPASDPVVYEKGVADAPKKPGRKK